MDPIGSSGNHDAGDSAELERLTPNVYQELRTGPAWLLWEVAGPRGRFLRLLGQTPIHGRLTGAFLCYTGVDGRT